MKTTLSLLLALALPLAAETVTFEWDHDAPQTVAEYALYRIDGEQRTLVGKTAVLTITSNAEPGQTFGVTAINADGIESIMSETLTLSFRPAPPGKPRVVKLQSNNSAKTKWRDVATLEFKHGHP